MSSKTIIPEQTAAVTVPVVIKFGSLEALPATLFATNLAGAETATIEISQDDGVTGNDLFQDGTVVQLNTTNTIFSINSPMTLMITKGATVGTAGVFLNKGPHQ